MDDESDLTAQGEALHKLIKAMHACRDAEVTRTEIAEVIRPYLLEDDDIIIEGSLIEHLSDGAASQIIEIVYGALLSGATFSFVDGRRTRDELRKLCEGIGEFAVTRDRKMRRVWITKPPS